MSQKEQNPPTPSPQPPAPLIVVRTSKLARAVGLIVASLASLAGLLFALYQTTLPRFFFALLVGIFLGSLLGIFVDAALSRLFSARERLKVHEGSITLCASRPITIHLSRPFDLLLWRGEGDHKERGGLVYLILAQDGEQLRLIGETGRGELTEEAGELLESAIKAPLLEMIDAGALPGTLSLPQEGAIKDILAALCRADAPRHPRGVLPARPHSLVIDGPRLTCGENTLDLSRVQKMFHKEDRLFLQEGSATWALSSKVFRKLDFPRKNELSATFTLEIPDAIFTRLILERLP